ncbi:MAG: LysR family transcriptional regulator [Xanthobacteraceae bacterium]|nr:LysR family transcriptional regulator [Xanthobacteraceae bacterium]
MNITLRQLYGFKAVADVGTFTAAAQRLKVAQPALSLNIRDLERELGARLFDRTTRRVELTAAGREFLQSVDKLIADLEQAVQNARELAERKRGRLVVAAPPLLAAMVVPGAVADYKKRFPSIDVSVIDTQTNVIVDKVRSGEADCGIGTFAEAEEGIRKEVLFEDALMAWFPAHSPSSRSSRLAWKDLPGQLIAMTRDSRIRFLVDQVYQSAGQTMRPAYEVSHMTTAIMMVEAGLGVAVLPAYVWGFARAFNVTARVLFEPEVRREMAIIHASGRALSPAAEAFTRYLKKRAGAALPRGLRQTAAEQVPGIHRARV